MKKLFNWKLLLLLIFLFGSFWRFYRLGSIPGGFHADEAAFGYNAYSLLHTLKDEYGKFLPVILKSSGDYKGAVYAYLDIPFVAAFGLTPFAERLPSAILGSLTIPLVYFFIKKLLNNHKIALISSFILAISPWHINITRVTGDVIVGLFFSISMTYGLLRLQDKFSKFWLLTTIVSAILAMFSYAPYRFYVILIPLILFFLYIKRTKKSFTFNKNISIFFVIILIFSFFYATLGSIDRFNQVSIFSNPETELILQEQIREDQNTPIFITRFFHNKVFNHSRTILKNIGQYFTFDYLFLSGGYPLRERIPSVGLFYIWEAFFLFFGIFIILKRRHREELFLLFWWIILLLPTVITFDEIPNVRRNIIILPAMAAIIGIGIYEALIYTYNKRLKLINFLFGALLIVVIYEFSYFIHQYFIHQENHHPWYRGYAYKELTSVLRNYYSNYEKIVVTKEKQTPYIYFLFYNKYDPIKYQKEGSPRDLDYSGFDKYFFIPLSCPLNGGKTGYDVRGEFGVLYINEGECPISLRNVKVLDTINWQNGTPAFRILEYTEDK